MRGGRGLDEDGPLRLETARGRHLTSRPSRPHTAAWHSVIILDEIGHHKQSTGQPISFEQVATRLCDLPRTKSSKSSCVLLLLAINKMSSSLQPEASSSSPNFQACDSPEAILTVLEGKANELNQSRSSDERLTKWLNPTVNILNALSSTLGEGVSSVGKLLRTPWRTAAC
ncbi:hypothetical protein EDB86DRAFT_2094861 [Lactarius hatsudake]|nr:hypothetical protein EDB86DRAFT_2094861 [Lactarius hatsudake]